MDILDLKESILDSNETISMTLCSRKYGLERNKRIWICDHLQTMLTNIHFTNVITLTLINKNWKKNKYMN